MSHEILEYTSYDCWIYYRCSLSVCNPLSVWRIENFTMILRVTHFYTESRVEHILIWLYWHVFYSILWIMHCKPFMYLGSTCDCKRLQEFIEDLLSRTITICVWIAELLLTEHSRKKSNRHSISYDEILIINEQCIYHILTHIVFFSISAKSIMDKKVQLVQQRDLMRLWMHLTNLNILPSLCRVELTVLFCCYSRRLGCMLCLFQTFNLKTQTK